MFMQWVHALSGACFDEPLESWVNVPLASTSSHRVRQPREELARSVAWARPSLAFTQEIGFAFGIHRSLGGGASVWYPTTVGR